MEKEKCRICGKELMPDLEALNYATKEWDEHTYMPCDCIEITNKDLRISIG